MIEIKSNFTIKRIFAYVSNLKKLNLIKYNSKLQKTLNVDINNYKNTSNRIEIEIIPVIGLKFINLNFIEVNNDDISIYFDDQKVMRNNTKISDKIQKIKISFNSKKININGIFKGCTGIDTLKFIRCNNKHLTDFCRLFYDCKNLRKRVICSITVNYWKNLIYQVLIQQKLKIWK